MGTKKRRPSIEQVELWIRRGFGQGSGASYLPWVYIRDVPSVGNSNSVYSQATGRTHHYLSRGEQDLHFEVEYGAPLDIREQYALLPWEELQDVARKVGIRYPTIPYTRTPAVLTTDMVVSMATPSGRRLLAVSVKQEKDVEDPRTVQKLWLERYYWMRRGIDWILYISKEEPSLLAQNLRFFEGALRHAVRVESCPISPTVFSNVFERHWSPTLTLNQICALASAELGLDDPGDGIRQLGAAVWQKISRIRLGVAKIGHDACVSLNGQ